MLSTDDCNSQFKRANILYWLDKIMCHYKLFIYS